MPPAVAISSTGPIPSTLPPLPPPPPRGILAHHHPSLLPFPIGLSRTSLLLAAAAAAAAVNRPIAPSAAAVAPNLLLPLVITPRPLSDGTLIMTMITPATRLNRNVRAGSPASC